MELLNVHPRKLTCPFAPNRRTSFSLLLRNNSRNNHVAFLFVDTGRTESSSLCRRGVIPPQSTWGIVLHIELKGMEQALQENPCKDMVIVRSTIVSQGFLADDITLNMFNKQEFLYDIELEILFVEAPGPQPNLSLSSDELQLGANEGTGHATNQVTTLPIHFSPFSSPIPNVLITSDTKSIYMQNFLTQLNVFKSSTFNYHSSN